MARVSESAPTRSGATVALRSVLKGLSASAAFAPLTIAAISTAHAQPTVPNPVSSHPRLWLTEADLPRLRGWATENNPVWRDGLLPIADALTAQMDAGSIPGEDDGGTAWTEYPT